MKIKGFVCNECGCEPPCIIIGVSRVEIRCPNEENGEGNAIWRKAEIEFKEVVVPEITYLGGD